jgi:serine protease Do
MEDEKATHTVSGENFVIIGDKKEKIKEQETEETKRTEQSANNETQKDMRSKGRETRRKILAIILVIVISASAGYIGGYAAVSSRGASGQSQIKIETNGTVNTAEAVADKVLPSVVGISTKTQVVSENFFGMISNGVSEGVGTGIIVDPRGYILTNSHVIMDGKADTITVQLPDARKLPGKVLWNDTTLDLAMVKVNATGLTAAELGNSDKVKIGQYAVAIGNPLGMAFERSVTQGVISGLNRTLTVSDTSGDVTMDGLMQTDASINAGNSGGPLLNSKGQVIGINSAKAASAEGLGFAIPINTAKPIIEEIIANGTFKKAFIGITGVNVDLYLQYYPTENLGTKTGVYVSEVAEASPADLGGLKKGDVITAIDKTGIDTMQQLMKSLFSYKPGDTVTLTVHRGGEILKKEVKLGVSGK